MNEIICGDTPLSADCTKNQDFDLMLETACFEQAVQDARALAKKMGKGWTGYVWENLGWHYRVCSPCRRITIHANYHDAKLLSYTAFINSPGESGGIYDSGGKTPQAAMANVLKVTRGRIRFLNSLVEGL